MEQSGGVNVKGKREKTAGENSENARTKQRASAQGVEQEAAGMPQRYTADSIERAGEATPMNRVRCVD